MYGTFITSLEKSERAGASVRPVLERGVLDEAPPRRDLEALPGLRREADSQPPPPLLRLPVEQRRLDALLGGEPQPDSLGEIPGRPAFWEVEQSEAALSLVPLFPILAGGTREAVGPAGD